MIIIALIAWVVISIILTIKWCGKTTWTVSKEVLCAPALFGMGIIIMIQDNFNDYEPPFFNGIEK